jgi:hypothetical protein
LGLEAPAGAAGALDREGGDLLRLEVLARVRVVTTTYLAVIITGLTIAIIVGLSHH